jgi:hypothetical protein
MTILNDGSKDWVHFRLLDKIQAACQPGGGRDYSVKRMAWTANAAICGRLFSGYALPDLNAFA